MGPTDNTLQLKHTGLQFGHILCMQLSIWNNSDPTGRIFIKFLYLNIFRKYVEKIQVALQSDENNEYFMWRPKYIYDSISLNYS